MVLTTRQFQSQQYNASAIDARGPMVLARAAACQIVGLLVQLGELSQFALDIYHALGYETFSTSSRIDAIAVRTANIEHNLAIYSDEIEATSPSYYFHNNSEMNWKRNDRMTTGLFSVDSRSIPLAKLVQTAFAPPNMAEMTEFIGRDCAQLYSDPDFFFKHWAAEEQRKIDLEAQEKKKQRQARPKRNNKRQSTKIEVQAIEVKVYSAHGKEFSDFGPGTTVAANRTTGTTSIAAPRPVQVSAAPAPAPVSVKPALAPQPSITNHYSDAFQTLPPQSPQTPATPATPQPFDDYGQESFSQFMPVPSFSTPPTPHQPPPSQPIAPPQPQSPISSNTPSGTNLDDILASKVKAATATRLAPPPPRAANAPVPAPRAAPQPPKAPQVPPTQPTQPEEDYYAQPPPPQEQYHHTPPPQQDYYPSPPQSPPQSPPISPPQSPAHYQQAPPPQPFQPPTPPPQSFHQPPTPPQQQSYALPPQSPMAATPSPAPSPRPVNPAAAALMGAGGLPTLNKPTPVQEAPTPRGNPLLGAIRGGVALKSAAEAKAADPAPPRAGGGGFLADIKSRPMLRKASVVATSAPKPAPAAAGGLSAVMDILARRGAIADTDSESDDDDDWD